MEEILKNEELLRKAQVAQSVAEHGDQVLLAKWKPSEEALYAGIGFVYCATYYGQFFEGLEVFVIGAGFY